MQFEGGATATLQMVAFTERDCATEVQFYGTKVNGSYIICHDQHTVCLEYRN